MKGYTYKMAYILTANSLRDLELASISSEDNVLLHSDIQSMLAGKKDSINFVGAQASIFG